MGTVVCKVEKFVNKWIVDRCENLNPAQQRVLNITLNTVDKIFNWARYQEGEAPSEDVRQAGLKMIEVIEDDEIEEVLEGVKEHSAETFVHSLRVAIYLILFARNLNKEKTRFTPNDILEFAMGGILHDLGKVKVPLKILHKPGRN